MSTPRTTMIPRTSEKRCRTTSTRSRTYRPTGPTWTPSCARDRAVLAERAYGFPTADQFEPTRWEWV
jgi:hypothetical protein